jgi:hypothetical protein
MAYQNYCGIAENNTLRHIALSRIVATAPLQKGGNAPFKPQRRSLTEAHPTKIGAIDNTTDTIETSISGKQNDTATLQSTDYTLT